MRHRVGRLYVAVASIGLLGAALGLFVSHAEVGRTSVHASVRCMVTTDNGTERAGALLPSGECMLASGDVYDHEGKHLAPVSGSDHPHRPTALGHNQCLALDALGHVLRKRDGSVRVGAAVNGGLCMLPNGYAFKRAQKESAQ